jgi:hypothetical protein
MAFAIKVHDDFRFPKGLALRVLLGGNHLHPRTFKTAQNTQ